MLVSGVELATHLAQALVHHVLHSLQFGLLAKGANALDLVGQDGEGLWQVHIVERNQHALAASYHQARRAAIGGRHQV